MENKKTQQNQNNAKQAHTTQSKASVKAGTVKKEKMDAKTEQPNHAKTVKKA